MTNEDRMKIVSGLARECEEWTREELILFAYDRLYEEYSQRTDRELLLMMGEQERLYAEKHVSSNSFKLLALPEKY